MPQTFIEALDHRVLVCDGAMGTMLYAKGVFINKSFDALNLSQPDLVLDVHQQYVRAGSRPPPAWCVGPRPPPTPSTTSMPAWMPPTSGPASPPRYRVYAGAELIAEASSLAEAGRALEEHAERVVAERAPDQLFVHAGVVGWDGRAIVIPGASFAGKTTLVQAWLEAGATYYSDEFAVLDREGRVHPFARPLAIRDGSGTVTRQVPVAALGAESGTTPLVIGLVLGVLVVLAGIVLSAPGVPGPGIVTILLGLGFLALEFDWAERWMARVIIWGDRAAERAEHSTTRQRVIAGGDCGFSSQATYNPELHPKIVWAKFQAMAEGAKLASRQLWR